MFVVDANVLLYAVNQRAPEHEAARGWLESALARQEAVGAKMVSSTATSPASTGPAAAPA